MPLQVAIVAVDGNKELRTDQVNHQPQLFLAAMSADVDQPRGAVIIDHLGIAPLQVVDHAIDRLLIARNHARAHQHGVAGIDLGELVIVHRGPAQCAHRFALRSADHDAQLVRRIVLDLARIDDQSLRQVEIAKVLRDLGGIIQRPPDDRNLAAMLMRQLHRQPNAVNRRREATEEQLLLSPARRSRPAAAARRFSLGV